MKRIIYTVLFALLVSVPALSSASAARGGGVGETPRRPTVRQCPRTVRSAWGLAPGASVVPDVCAVPRGLAFMRGPSAPAWLVDVAWRLVPCSVGIAPRFGEGATVREPLWAANRGLPRPDSTPPVTAVVTVDDYSELWYGDGPRSDLGEGMYRDAGYELDPRGELRESARMTDPCRSDLRDPETFDDRSLDRYVDPR
ncbi:MAG: hypothetical protein GF400_04160 [Candidatus Eisenbacteria bacterium]|nr:hypothetical protein [Candidatus Eisenbacteria bacterium]